MALSEKTVINITTMKYKQNQEKKTPKKNNGYTQNSKAI